MPLRAYANEEEVISIDLNDEQWSELKQKLKNSFVSIKLPCCGQEGYLRKSKNGFKHFVHKHSSDNCNWQPESKEHLMAKSDIIEACRLCGWDAIPEFSENDWRADVLAVKKDLRIAFEVQWSRQSFEETKFRQEKFNKSNVRGCWFFKNAPKEMTTYSEELKADNDLPAFKLGKSDEGELFISVNNQFFPLRVFVEKLLNRQVQFRDAITSKVNQEVSIAIFDFTCWKCKKAQHCYTVTSDIYSNCGRSFNYRSSMWDDSDLDKNKGIVQAIESISRSNEGKKYKIGKVKNRYSKTIKGNYLSHGCYYCNALFGDFLLKEEKREALFYTDPDIFDCEVELDPITEDRPHWCISEDGHFCN